MLRGLGVLDVGHGRRTRVREMGAGTLGQLVPLMMMSGGQALFEHVFEVRLALESMSARLAAGRRTEAQVARLHELANLYRAQAEQGSANALNTDLAFHAEVAQASGNPLFPALLEALSGFISYSQRESCRDDAIRVQRATVSHETIAEAIAAKDSGWAAAEMEAHLQFSRSRRIQPGSSPQDTTTTDQQNHA
jgi:GntR family transcriptional repressor for pyruvate dehydrogenase complex